MELRVLTPLPFVRLCLSVLVGVFGVPAQLDTDALTVNGGGLFLHGVKGKKKPRQLARSGLMSEALRRSERMGKGTKRNPCHLAMTRETKTEHTMQMYGISFNRVRYGS
jgi:hypothetical protein